MTAIGLRIKKIRTNLNLTQNELARKAKLSQSSLHYIEKGVNSPAISTLEKIASALNITIAQLLLDEES